MDDPDYDPNLPPSSKRTDSSLKPRRTTRTMNQLTKSTMKHVNMISKTHEGTYQKVISRSASKSIDETMDMEDLEYGNKDPSSPVNNKLFLLYLHFVDKAQQDRSDNAILRNDNDNLRNENSRLQNALRSLVCSNCGGTSISFDDQQLRMENARLKEELDRVCAIASQFCGNNPMQAHGQGHLPPLMTSNRS